MKLHVLALADDVSEQLYDRFRPERWNSVDLVLSAGDIPPTYLDFLCTRLDVPVLYVRGNHDGGYAQSEYDGSTNIHGRIVTVRGVRIAGIEGSMRYNDGRVQYTESQMRRIVRRLQVQALRHGTPDIVLTHAPIAGFHDGADVCHRGFASFRSLVEAWKPAYFVHGHTHHHYSRQNVDVLDGTTVINAYPFQMFDCEVRPSVAPARASIGARLRYQAHRLARLES